MFSAEFVDGPMEGTRYEFIGADGSFADLYAIANPTDDEAPWAASTAVAVIASPVRSTPCGRAECTKPATDRLPDGHVHTNRVVPR